MSDTNLHALSDSDFMSEVLKTEEPATDPKADASEAEHQAEGLVEEGESKEELEPDDTQEPNEGDEEVVAEEEELPEEPEDGATDVDFEAAYNKIFSPFKAGGKEFTVKSVDEAIQLMQMGVGFYKKTQELAPHLKIIKTLEKNGLADLDKINLLVDVFNKKPAAVQRLLNDVGYDTMDYDELQETYVPANNLVSDQEVALSEVVNELSGISEFTTLSNDLLGWDDQSKSIISDHPHILRILTDNVRTGIYGKVMEEVERRRTLGHLGNQSVLESYRQVVESLAQADKGAAGRTKEPPSQPNTTADRDARRRAASPTRAGTQSRSQSIDEDSLYRVSDADFLKLVKG